jgi:hypothetical protein
LAWCAAISALTAIPVLALAQQGGPQPNVPKLTKADVLIVVQIVTKDKAKTQAYCDLIGSTIRYRQPSKRR